MSQTNDFNACVVIPCFNHGSTVAEVVQRLSFLTLPFIVIDDGSDLSTAEALSRLEAERADVSLLRLSSNHGKGVAVMRGLAVAQQRGFSHALQVDADGQHELEKARELLALAADHPHALISGRPVYDASVPRSRLYGRYVTHVLVWVQTLSLMLQDSMCGFRVYPVNATLALGSVGARMDFDTEVMVRLYWAGTQSLFVPVRVVYPVNGLSNFRMLRDNLRMAWLHTRLLLGMLLRLPRLLMRRGRSG